MLSKSSCTLSLLVVLPDAFLPSLAVSRVIQSCREQRLAGLTLDQDETCFDVQSSGPSKPEMRPSPASMSGGGHMPGGHRYTGWWGASGGPTQKGITQYTLSHFRQNPLQGAFKHSLFQGFSRIVAQIPYFLVPFVVGYGTISWAVKKNEWYNSKEGHLATAEHDE